MPTAAVNPLPPACVRWLFVAACGVVAFGLLLVLAPALARQGFSLMLYGRAGVVDAFDAQAVRYVSLAHAVLGAVMIGWGVALGLAVRAFAVVRPRATWTLVAGSLAAWFVPDTTVSLWTGHWPNAVLNVVFATLFAVPLWASRDARRIDA